MGKRAWTPGKVQTLNPWSISGVEALATPSLATSDLGDTLQSVTAQ